MMSNVVEYAAKALVDNPDDVHVTEEERDDGRIVIHLSVAEGDVGKVIGRDGRIANALRSLTKVAAIREDVRASLEISD